MVPAGNVVVNVGVAPLVGVEIKNYNVVELTLGVPAAIRIKFVIKGEERMTATTFG